METYALAEPIAGVWLSELRHMATLDGPMVDAEQNLLAAIAEHVGAVLPPARSAPTDAELRASCADATHSRRLVELAILMALADRKLDSRALAELDRVRRVTGGDDPLVGLLPALRDGNHRKLAMAFRKRIMGRVLKRMWQQHGPVYSAKTLYVMLRRMRGAQPWNRAQARKYQRLGLLAEGTLGRATWELTREQNYHFPGEPHGLVEETAYHDVSHVIGDYDTSPLGEQLHSCFIAGYHRPDRFGPFVSSVLQYHWKVELTPISSTTEGIFDAARMFEAARRGDQCPIDLSLDFPRIWHLMPESVSAARRELRIPPRRDSAASLVLPSLRVDAQLTRAA
jgi:hypothetical protein